MERTRFEGDDKRSREHEPIMRVIGDGDRKRPAGHGKTVMPRGLGTT
jgi:hypothetical protein